MGRIELPTSPLPRECSTTEPHGQPGAPDGVELSLELAVITRFVLVRALRYQQKYHQVLTAWGFNHLKTAAAMVSRIPKRRAL